MPLSLKLDKIAPDSTGKKHTAYMHIVDDSGKVLRPFDVYYDPENQQAFIDECDHMLAEEEDKIATIETTAADITSLIEGTLTTMAAERATARLAKPLEIK
jgi:hypothetical protein